MNYDVRKCLSNAGRHRLVPLWNTNAEGIRDKIIRHLASTAWSSIDVVRIGYEDDGDEHVPLILWIGIDTGTMAHEVGAAITVRCRQELVRLGIHDVECEIRETELNRLAAPALPLRGDFDVLHSHLTLTSATGQCVAAGVSPNIEGTLGPYLAVDGDTKCVLTSRHVALRANNERYRHRPTTTLTYNLVMPGDETQKQLEERSTRAAVLFNDALASAIQSQGLQAPGAVEWLLCLLNADAIRDHLLTLRPQDARHVGHIYTLPALTPVHLGHGTR